MEKYTDVLPIRRRLEALLNEAERELFSDACIHSSQGLELTKDETAVVQRVLLDDEAAKLIFRSMSPEAPNHSLPRLVQKAKFYHDGRTFGREPIGYG